MLFLGLGFMTGGFAFLININIYTQNHPKRTCTCLALVLVMTWEM